MNSLRRELEDSSLHFENSTAILRKKNADAIAELSDQIGALHKIRTKFYLNFKRVFFSLFIKFLK